MFNHIAVLGIKPIFKLTFDDNDCNDFPEKPASMKLL